VEEAHAVNKALDFTQMWRCCAAKSDTPLEFTLTSRDRRFFDNYAFYGSGIPGDDETVAFANHALDVMASLGATIVNTDSGAIEDYFNDEFTALLFEFKVQIAQYLQTLGHTNMRTLADLIAFNNAHCPQELMYYGQDIFEAAQMTTGLSDPTYIAARNHATGTAQAGIDGALQRDHLDAIVAPHLTNSTAPAVTGLSQLFDAGRHPFVWKTRRHADVQHSAA